VRTKRYSRKFQRIELDPASPSANVEARWVFLSAGAENDAAAVLQKALKLGPEYPSALYFLARISEVHKLTGEAVAYLERAAASSGRTPKYVHALGMAYAEFGKNEAARRLLDELRWQAKQQYVDPDYIASLAAKVAESSHL
jgi:Flp pilus assembly protein TadD